MNQALPVLIVGSMAFDDLELPTGSAKDVIGGSATYSAYAASSFTQVRVVAVVGDDFPAATLADMQAHGIDTAGVERAAGRTFRWAGRYDTDLIHRTTLDTQLNVFASFQPKIPAAYRETPMVLLGNIHPALQLQVLDQVAKPRVVVADTMNFWIEGEPAILAEVLKRVDILVINDEEARQLSGHINIRRAAREIHTRGPKRIIIKRGEHGALLFDEHGVFAAPGFPLEDVIDPTGAGDSFAGGFMGYLAAQSELTALALRRAMIHATATASFCVEAVGTKRVSEVSRADVATRVAAIRSLYDFGAHTM
ncbi:Ribokinase [Minicystis rosea]|nr:Ribokinase [Minicystis rosea]